MPAGGSKARRGHKSVSLEGLRKVTNICWCLETCICKWCKPFFQFRFARLAAVVFHRIASNKASKVSFLVLSRWTVLCSLFERRKQFFASSFLFSRLLLSTFSSFHSRFSLWFLAYSFIPFSSLSVFIYDFWVYITDIHMTTDLIDSLLVFRKYVLLIWTSHILMCVEIR